MKSMKKFFLKLGLSLMAIPSLSIQLTAKDSFGVSYDTTVGADNPKPQKLRTSQEGIHARNAALESPSR